METSDLLIQLLMYGFLTLWGLAGFLDWCCHRATDIEHTTGLKETFMHSLMGIQIAIPILLCLLFYVNILVLLICFVALILHELVAHWDVRYAAQRREISIWEMHAHNYLATLPLYMFTMIIILNWEIVSNLTQLNWSEQFILVPVQEAHGSQGFLLWYLVFMSIFCVFPYIEEFIRCLRVKIFEPPKQSEM